MLSKLFTGSKSARMRRYIGLMGMLRDRGHHHAANFVAFRIQNQFGCYVAPTARIARSVQFPHPTGIVIGEGVVIGEGAKIYQNVTLGGARVGDQKAGNYPEIGPGVTLFAGVVVAGSIKIGAGSTIGANSVVLHDVPEKAVAVGAPARVVRMDAEHTTNSDMESIT